MELIILILGFALFEIIPLLCKRNLLFSKNINIFSNAVLKISFSAKKHLGWGEWKRIQFSFAVIWAESEIRKIL